LVRLTSTQQLYSDFAGKIGGNFAVFGEEMKVRISSALLLLTIILTACAGNQAEEIQPTETSTPKVEETPTQPPLPTDPGQVNPEAADWCNVVSPRPTPGPTQESLFPSPGEDDWIKGPESAKVTIIEYSDFQ
jgi:hypothetical protein